MHPSGEQVPQQEQRAVEGGVPDEPSELQPKQPALREPAHRQALQDNRSAAKLHGQRAAQLREGDQGGTLVLPLRRKLVTILIVIYAQGYIVYLLLIE